MSAREVERMEAAAQWWARFQEAEPSEEEVTQWLTWLEVDPRNAASFEDLNNLAQRVHSTREAAPRRLQPLRVPAATGGRSMHRLAIAALLLVAVGALWLLGSASTAWMMAERSAYSTPVADQRQILLPDGSRFTLGGASAVETVFSDDRRFIRMLAGEAFFEVTADTADRQFVVDTGTATVRALGTAFNIRRSGQRVTITVTEGRVQVQRSGNALQTLAVAAGLRQRQSVQLGRDEQLVVEPDSPLLQVAAADSRRVLAWQEGRLEFADEPLDVVLHSVARYSNIVLQPLDPRLGRITYTGTFVPGQLDSWLGALEEVFGFAVKREAGVLKIAFPKSDAITS